MFTFLHKGTSGCVLGFSFILLPLARYRREQPQPAFQEPSYPASGSSRIGIVRTVLDQSLICCENPDGRIGRFLSLFNFQVLQEEGEFPAPACQALLYLNFDQHKQVILTTSSPKFSLLVFFYFYFF